MVFATRVLLIVLIEGFVTLSAQILTMRQLIPFIGNSIIVTSSIIGVMLLFLALGYRRGGDYTSNYERILRRNFLISAVLISVGLSYLFVYSVFSALKDINPLVTLYLYLFVISAPLVYLLGQTIPVATNLANESRVGRISGQALFLSTLGSFAGSIVTAAVLIPFLGVAKTIVVCVILLILLLVILMRDVEASLKKGVTYAMALTTIIISYYLNVVPEDGFFITTNAHANYQIDDGVIETNNESAVSGKYMLINNAASGFLGDDQTTGLWYINKFREIVTQDWAFSSADILVLGAGGFVASAGDQSSNRYTFVDIDAEINEIAGMGFIESINGEFVAADARQYVRYADTQYDVILSDAYSNKTTIPEHMVTQGYLNDVKSKLKPGGYAVLNIIAYPDFNHPFSHRMSNTIESVFGKCQTVYGSLNPKKLTNILYLCSAERNEDTVVYTDNLNVVTYDHTKKFN